MPDTRSDQSRCLGAEAPGARGAGGRGAGARRAHHLSVIGANQGPQAILLATDPHLLVYLPRPKIEYEWKYIQVLFVGILLCGRILVDPAMHLSSTQDASGLIKCAKLLFAHVLRFQ